MTSLYKSLQADGETSTWLFGRTAWVPVGILALYFSTAFLILPLLVVPNTPMRGIKAMLSVFAFMHNFLMLVVNSGLTAYFVSFEMMGNYSQICQPMDVGKKELHHYLALGMWVYFVSKIFELLDTVIIILRRPEQATFVHYYHHSTMLVLAWLGLRFLPGGSSVILASINTSSNVLLYFYYHNVSLGWMHPQIMNFRQANLYLIVQFSAAFAHAFTGLVKNCGYPRPVLLLIMAYVGSIVGLFYARRGRRSKNDNNTTGEMTMTTEEDSNAADEATSTFMTDAALEATTSIPSVSLWKRLTNINKTLLKGLFGLNRNVPHPPPSLQIRGEFCFYEQRDEVKKVRRNKLHGLTREELEELNNNIPPLPPTVRKRMR